MGLSVDVILELSYVTACDDSVVPPLPPSLPIQTTEELFGDLSRHT